jgi:HNH endonuclease.
MLLEDDSDDEASGPTSTRPSFRLGTKAYMYNGHGSTRMALGKLLLWQVRRGFHYLDEYKDEYLKCAECGLYYPQAGVEIDHKVDWEQYISGSTTRKEQCDRYNDTSNLQILCSFCNGAKKKNASWHYTGGYRDGMYGP